MALSSDPFTIIYANASFLRLSGLPSERVVGSSFASVIADPSNENDERPTLLTDILASSGSGNHQKLQLVRSDTSQELVERNAKVIPVVEKKSETPDEIVSNVTHVAIDFLNDETRTIQRPSLVHQSSDLAVGVMG